jgi:hypothetical protein
MNDDALTGLDAAIQHLEVTLEWKRKGPPTQKQVYFLFCEKIPIPVDLTWGQASDLIDERLSQVERDLKQGRREMITEEESLFLAYIKKQRKLGFGRMIQIIGHEWYRTLTREHPGTEGGACAGCMPFASLSAQDQRSWLQLLEAEEQNGMEY